MAPVVRVGSVKELLAAMISPDEPNWRIELYEPPPCDALPLLGGPPYAVRRTRSSSFRIAAALDLNFSLIPKTFVVDWWTACLLPCPKGALLDAFRLLEWENS